ncbi:MAG: DNA polymerase III subunit alpha [Clostridia bacterium]|nr:DNA polymerase III subunit alpha [Clostridia bacterium]
MGKFVHLHLHSEYSLLDGAVRLTHQVFKKDDEGKLKSVTAYPLAEAVKAKGMDAVAITDHGNMYGVHIFVETMRKNGIKPIIGSEFYVADDMYVKTADVLYKNYHLVLLAKNMTGYKNLMKLSSASFVDGFYGKPRIDLDLLAKHSEGLICCTACLAGAIPRHLLHGDYEGAKNYALKMKAMFEEGDFYIELQDHAIPEEKKVLPLLYKLAKDIGVKVVATNDVHYIEKADADIQDTMECINLGCKKDEVNKARFENDSFYLKDYDEMSELFEWCPEALESTVEIADKVDGDYYVVDAGTNYIPKYTNEDMGDRDTKQYLHDIAWEKIKTRYDEITPEIAERLNYELSVIDECGFNDYFLIVWDYVHAAQQKGIPVGPGRGSGVGSIVAYAIGITDVDPLKYNLLFERFLSKERVSMPDFDIDFCFVRRPEIIDYCVDKYGADNVSQIIAYSTMSAKAAFKDVARVYNISYNDSNNWAKTIPGGKVMLKMCLTPGTDCYSEDFKILYETNPQAREIIDVAMRLEGMPRQTSEHAAGVVICGEPIVEHVALSRNGDDITTQYDKVMIERLGLLKMDFLGLKTLTDISEAIKYIKEDKGVDIDFHKLGYEDPKVYELISSGDCVAVFQLESGGMTKFMNQLQPSCLEDVMAGISMYRPGPMQFLDDFLKGKKNPDKVEYAHPLLKEVLEVTYGCIVYQEQVMQIAQKVAGYSFGGADIMRRGIAKKDLKKLEKQREIFLHGGILDGDKTKKYVPGAVANGMEESVANHLFEQILKFASYAFNKSHAAAYTFLTYQTAYLKCYYPTYLMVAVINNRITNSDELRHYVNYLRRQGVKIMAPDINRSKKVFSIEDGNVRYGLMGIKNVGEQAMEYVLTERQKGPFKDIKDFIERCSGQINKRMVESLIKGGAMDCFGKTRATLMASYERIMATVANDKKSSMTGQMSLFDELVEDVSVQYTELDEYPKQQLLAGEKEVLGMYVSGHPLDDYKARKGEFNFDTSMIYYAEDSAENTYDEEEVEDEQQMKVDTSWSGKQVSLGCIVSSYEKKMSKNNGQKFAVGTLEDKMGAISFSMYARAYDQYGALLDTDAPVKVYGRIDLRDESDPKVNVDRIEVWQNNQKETSATRSGILYVLISNLTEQKLVAGVLTMFPGDTPVQAQVKRDGKSMLMAYPMKVEICDELLKRIANIVGEERVKYVKK